MTTPAPSTGLAERLAKEIVGLPVDFDAATVQATACATEAIRRTIDLAIQAVRQMKPFVDECCYDTLNEAEQRIRNLNLP